MSDTWWIGVAYVDQQKEYEINRERHSDLRYNQGTSVMALIKEAITSIYIKYQRYSHCEVIFPMRDSHITGMCQSYGVFSNAGVVAKERTVSNPAYDTTFLKLSEAEFYKAMT